MEVTDDCVALFGGILSITSHNKFLTVVFYAIDPQGTGKKPTLLQPEKKK